MASSADLTEAIHQYIKSLNREFHTGRATEHSYRPYLKTLFEAFAPDLLVTNEPTRIACGAPDFILSTKNDVPVGYAEAKDLGRSLDDKANKNQFDRYKSELNNLIITDYMEFRLYRFGELVMSITLAELTMGKAKATVEPHPLHFEAFIDMIKDFCSHFSLTIKSPEKLARLMAGKARLLARNIENALTSDEESEANSTLRDQMEAFKLILIHDIKPKEFGDIYGQTIAYGMFAARLHDPTLPTFSRQEAATLIPKSNPFLRKLFGYIAGIDLDHRIDWIVNALAEIFRATDVADLLKDFGKATGQNDPMIHFYETFLAEYDPKLRKSRGVWYTPEPVVNFIVRAVDDILKTEFGLNQGLADTSKVKIKRVAQGYGSARKGKDVIEEVEVHKVQVLDPAAGTGTFLAEVVKQIYQKFKDQQGVWSNYVEEHLIPRINGFEILMASYAMAHLKLDMLLRETGYNPSANEQRFNIYLTNALEEHHPDTGQLWTTWLANEASEANAIKRDTPVMVVLGNPPYSGESQNKGDWIMKLMEDYKKEPGGKEKLKEKNPKWINDDYVKFLRFGQHLIEKNGEGVLAFINPHGFLDNPTFRGMRWNLLKTYDKIYTMDLHGNSKKKETAPDGSPDINVFDIQQGVSINLFIKTGKKKTTEFGKIYHLDLYGQREEKYKYLWKNSFKPNNYKKLPVVAPMFFMVKKDFDVEAEYNRGFSCNDCFPVNSVGIVTARDHFTIHDTKEVLKNTIERFLSINDETARKEFSLGSDVRDWQVNYARKDLEKSGPDFNNIVPIAYRPFDTKYTYYTGKSKGFHCMPRGEVMQHFIKGVDKNIGFITARSNKSDTCDHFFISRNIMETKCGERTTQSAIFPLYQYHAVLPEANSQHTPDEHLERTPNLNTEIVQEIAQKLGLAFDPEDKERDVKKEFAPIDLLDYIYAVLHSPGYREKYKEFLKIDFPRVPYPDDKKIFWKLGKLGGQLREIHLLESPVVENFITTFPVEGDNKITRSIHQKDFEIIDEKKGLGRLHINDAQYFDQIPIIAWNFYIGGYQPAQKWLKDRKGRKLDFDDIAHYQKIIVALTQTDRIMKEIDKIDFMKE